MAENSLRTVPFTVTGSSTGNLTVTGSSSNAVLVNRVVIDRVAAGSYTATIVLNPNRSGNDRITIRAVDDLNATGEMSFNLTVTGLNRPPVIAPIAPQTTPRNVPLQLAISITDPDTPVESLILTWSTADTNIVRNVTFGSVNGTTIATVRPQNDVLGTTTVTIFANDGVSLVGQSFSFSVVNQGPVLIRFRIRARRSTCRWSLRSACAMSIRHWLTWSSQRPAPTQALSVG
jgi:hypothetical protein